MTNTAALQNQPDQTAMQLEQMKYAYRHALQVIEQKEALLDATEAELCGKTLKIEQLESQLEKVSKDYAELYIKNEERDKRRRLSPAPSVATQLLKHLTALKKQMMQFVEEQRSKVQNMVARLIKKPVHIEQVEQNRDLETGKEWLSLSRVSPAFNGMYRISDGNHSSVSYFNARSQDFANKELRVRFWKPVVA